ncbi:hypothetical protein [Aquimarina algiphila]|nr:hypothetical protein [Aquimarina algiphila]
MHNAARRASACDSITTEVGVTLSKKTWNTAVYTNAIEFCYKDIDCKLKDFMNSERCSDPDPNGTLYLDFLVDLVGQNIRNSHWTKTYFSGITSTHPALNGHDGLFVQYVAISNSRPEQRITIDENAGATYADQKLGYTTGYDTYNAIHEAMEDSETLREKGDTPIKSTRELATNYLRWLRKEKQVNCCERDPQTNVYTLEGLNIYGRPIKVVNEWDKIIKAVDGEGNPIFPELNNGTRYTNPHRAVCTYKSNEPIGTCDSGELSNLDIVYNPYDKKTKVESEYDFDVKVLRDTDFILAM